jgi:L-arabinonolactonase
MTAGTASPVVACSNILGEGATWSVRAQRLYWVDIERGELWSLDPVTGQHALYRAPERLGAAVERESGGFLLALASGFALANSDLTSVTRVLDIEPDLATRLNDGRCDRQGRYIGGTMGEAKPRQPIGAVYRVDQRHEVTKLFGDVRVTNAICFSPDGRTMYFADSPSQRILAYGYDSDTGTPHSPRLFHDLSADNATPDGATVDSEGFVWNARFGAGEVVRHAPDGRIVQRISVPASRTTCPALGGPDLRTLYITTARTGLSAEDLQREPHAGDLFAIEVDVPGLAETSFAG